MSYQGPGSKPLGSQLYSGAGSMPPGMGAMGSMGGAGGFQAGGTQFGAGSMGGPMGAGGGGFTYGMASSGGSLFGAAS